MLELNLLPLIHHGHGKLIAFFLVAAVQIFENCYGVLPQLSFLYLDILCSVYSCWPQILNICPFPCSPGLCPIDLCLRVEHLTLDIILQEKIYITGLSD